MLHIDATIFFWFASAFPLLDEVTVIAMSSSSPSQRTPNDQEEAERKSRMKDMARESRFHFRNFAEHQARRDLKEEAMDICKPHIKTFAECSQEKGMMVVFSCRALWQEVNKCMMVHNSEEAWQKFKKEHEDEIERRARFERV